MLKDRYHDDHHRDVMRDVINVLTSQSKVIPKIATKAQNKIEQVKRKVEFDLGSK